MLPENSCPITDPGAIAGEGSMCRSDPQMPQNAISTTTSPAPGSGSGS